MNACNSDDFSKKANAENLQDFAKRAADVEFVLDDRER